MRRAPISFPFRTQSPPPVRAGAARIRVKAECDVQEFGTGGRDRTHADADLETAALPLSYTGIGIS
jgi:hypothetical protein